MLSSQQMECRRCGYTACQKSDLLRHLRRVRACEPVKEDVDRTILIEELTMEQQGKKVHKCDKCGKGYAARSGKSRHMKECTATPATVPVDVVQQLQSKLAIVEHELQQIKAQHTTVTNHGSINHNHGVINNIHIHSRGKEDISYLDWGDLTNCLMHQDLSPLIKLIHCNPQHPENANIRMKNRKERLMEQFVDGRWIVTDQEEVLTKLTQDGYHILYKHYKSNQNELDEEYLDDISTWLRKIREEDPHTVKPIHKQLVLLFLNRDVYILEK